MKLSSPSLSVIIFSLFVPVGLWFGFSIGNFTFPGLQNGAIPAETTVTPPTNGQRSILFIGVDHLNVDQPRLESIWLVLYLPGKPSLTLLPIFPVSTTSKSYLGSSWERTNPIGDDGNPSTGLLNILKKKQIWWSEYVLLDETAMIKVVDFLGGMTVGERYLDGALSLGSIIPPWESQSAAIQGQTELLQTLCLQPKRVSSMKDIGSILDLIPLHMRTNIEVSQALDDWQSLVTNEIDLTCEFPMLSVFKP